MTTIDPKVLKKIKKCLSLSSSSNPNEAATALRQAHALMEKHGVSSHEITMSDIGEATVDSKTMARDKPAHWETLLVALVGRAFGCQMLVQRMLYPQGLGHANEGRFIFVGLKQQAEIASYTATVLIRKCKSSRQKWVSENLSGLGRGIPGGKAKMTRMGDAFAEGWVNSIGKLVADFANPPEVVEAISRHIDAQASGNKAPTRSIHNNGLDRNEQIALAIGMKAAQGESLYRPMDTSDAPLALESMA